MSIAARLRRLPPTPIFILALCVFFGVPLGFVLYRSEKVRRRMDVEARATVDRFLEAMARGDFRAAEAETAEIPGGDAATAGTRARHVWGRGWKVIATNVTGAAEEWATVEGEITGTDAKVRTFSMRLKPERGWKITSFATGDASLLPFPRITEAPDAIPIIDLRILKREAGESSWRLQAEVDLVAPALGREGRWVRRGVMLRARILDPRGTMHETGGVSSTWDADPEETGRKTLTHEIEIPTDWGSGRYRITIVAEDRSGHSSSRDIAIEIP